MAGTFSWAQLMANGKLALSTTMVLGLALNTSLINCSCAGCRSMEVRSMLSLPSLGSHWPPNLMVSQVGLLAMTTMAASEDLAASTAALLSVFRAKFPLIPEPALLLIPSSGVRSEERRVGKE